ncbi:ferric reductase like transmembrane component-domain-containing protein [Yarrowia lipolytica]|jgi:hypothetical protein|uniref:YALI0B17292p n=2 Tax=Yarrowia lipolytica TaxID=4952 RepID=Q6CEA2_YARLI|nr:YALI0B17292p [Yarrowia lipolytica CLIB122]AOW01832.1 hypothetical protein YALI1_B22499g [Yarrowia lipolytica]KAB8280780.1 ferric reductase like transmembrane component-domain-containing protein [Yarrowia lipolytica]KAE8170020.1 ferric reductase like transmembrane component-domain-containing protein [Yarrowia lipolytica]KAJ8052623.1 ferric reductase like transmembrane component-domain-containing protein [Yarrowia lipolytica]QNP97085.1 Putative ferric reductase transmembrane component [Yarrow|eukprot:XP_501010.1 YALI0B17292p [Yarrowia lipolytica CLIB122]
MNHTDMTLECETWSKSLMDHLGLGFNWHMDNKPAPAKKAFRKLVTRQWGLYSLAVTAIFILGAYALTNVAVDAIVIRRLRKYARPPGTRVQFFRQGLRLRLMIPLLLTIVTVCSLVQTYQDFIFLTKRLGRVSAALYPAMLFLALRPSPLPRTFYLALLPVHKWLSRIVVLTTVLHSIFYAYIYYSTGVLGKKMAEIENIYGIIATALFLLIAATSIAPIRRKMYPIFYGIHYPATWACVFLIWGHARPPANGYFYCSLAILIGQILYRIWTTTHVKPLSIFPVSPTLFLVTYPNVYKRGYKPSEYGGLPSFDRDVEDHDFDAKPVFTPASHIRLSSPLWQPATWMKSSHPYTVASRPEDDHLQLVVRKSNFFPDTTLHANRNMSLTGPFCSVPSTFFIPGAAKRVLLVCGGTGISFAAPVLRHCADRGIPCKLVWAIREVRDVAILPLLGIRCDTSVNVEIEVYVSRPITSLSPTKAGIMNDYRSSLGNKDEAAAADDIDINIEACGHGCCTPCQGNPERVPLLEAQKREAKHQEQQSQAQSHAQQQALGEIPVSSNGTIDYNAIQPVKAVPLLRRPRKMTSTLLRKSWIPTEYDSPLAQFTMISSKLALNLDLAKWLSGVLEPPCGSRNSTHTTGGTCCMQVPGLVDKTGCWVLASGSVQLVRETSKWAADNSFLCVKDEYSM